MSERQAKKKKMQETEIVVKKAPKKGKILFNTISVLVILVFLGLAVWGISQSKKDTPKTVEPIVDTTYDEMDDSLGTMAAQQGLTFEEYAEKYAMNTEIFSPTSSYEESINLFTLETISKLENYEDINTYIEARGLPADVDITIPNAELPTNIMMKVYGFDETFEELKPYGIPEDMTEETKWIDSKDYIMNAEQVKTTSEMTAGDNGGAE